MKTRFKAEYGVSRESFNYITEKYNQIDFRFVDFTITGDTKEQVEEAFYKLEEYMNAEGFKFSTCPTMEQNKKGQWEYLESITVRDKEEGVEVLDLYREFKKQHTEPKAEVEVVEEVAVDVVEVKEDSKIENKERVVTYEILQMQHVEENDPRFHYLRSKMYWGLKPGEKSLDVVQDNYKSIYTRITKTDKSDMSFLEGLFYTFNADRPADYKGRSLSVSDMVRICDYKGVRFYRCESIGWQEVEVINWFEFRRGDMGGNQ